MKDVIVIDGVEEEIKYTHFRDKNQFGEIEAKGGITMAQLSLSTDSNNRPRSIIAGVSYCSIKDSYSKRFGRELSKQRLINAIAQCITEKSLSDMVMGVEPHEPQRSRRILRKEELQEDAKERDAERYNRLNET